MDDSFCDGEKLYRAVRPGKMYRTENGGVSSAAFKESIPGCSVDRGNSRTDAEAAKFLRNSGRIGDICCFYVKDCVSDGESEDIFLKYRPTDKNQYHTELFRNPELKKMTSGQCKRLARRAKFVIEENDNYLNASFG